MLTKSERKFIAHPDSVSKRYAAVLKIRINRKILELKQNMELVQADVDLIVSHSDSLGFDIMPLHDLPGLHVSLQKSVTMPHAKTVSNNSAINILASNSFA